MGQRAVRTSSPFGEEVTATGLLLGRKRFPSVRGGTARTSTRTTRTQPMLRLDGAPDLAHPGGPGIIRSSDRGGNVLLFGFGQLA